MNAVDTPAEVAEQWNAVKAFYKRFATQVESTKADSSGQVDVEGRGALAELVAESAGLQEEYTTLTDYYFVTC